MERGDKPVAQLALELGVPRNRLYKWREAVQTEGAHAFRGSGRRSPQQQELAQLRKQVARLEQENTILKKKRRRTSRARPSAVRLDRWTTTDVSADRPVPGIAGIGQRLSRMEAAFAKRTCASRRAPGSGDHGHAPRTSRALWQPSPVA